ncbi:MAG: MFS transporter [Gemmatimonadaceae bacterium]
MTHPSHKSPVVAASGEIRARRAPALERWSWALYDFSNTIFSMNIATLFFAVWLVDDLHGTNTMVAIGNGVSSALVALSIPLFGAISDASQRRKPWVVWFTLAAVAATIFMGVVGQFRVPLIGEAVIDPAVATYTLHGTAAVAIITSFIIANYAYQGAQPFYNAMMFELAPPVEQGRLSGVGTALGYVGSIVGVLLVTPFFNGTVPVAGALPEGFLHAMRAVFPFTSHAGRVSTFSPTGILFLLFSLPLFFFCKDHNAKKVIGGIPWRKGFADLSNTIRDARKYPGTIRFILASFLYQDAIGTIVANMALYAVKAMDFKKGLETTLFVALTVPAVIGSYAIGKLVDRIGPKKSLMFTITCWVILLIAMIFVPNQMSFWIVGAAIGLIFGGVPTAERPMLMTLVPDAEAGRFFSLMVLSSRAAAIVGPFIWALTVDGLLPSYGTGFAYRAGVVTVAIGMLGSLAILWAVPDRWQRSSPT